MIIPSKMAELTPQGELEWRYSEMIHLTDAQARELKDKHVCRPDYIADIAFTHNPTSITIED